MYSWGDARHQSTVCPAALDSDEWTNLTAEEIVQLAKVRARYDGHPKCIEFDIDERRLVFARWLMEHGCLSEDV